MPGTPRQLRRPPFAASVSDEEIERAVQQLPAPVIPTRDEDADRILSGVAGSSIIAGNGVDDTLPNSQSTIESSHGLLDSAHRLATASVAVIALFQIAQALTTSRENRNEHSTPAENV